MSRVDHLFIKLAEQSVGLNTNELAAANAHGKIEKQIGIIGQPSGRAASNLLRLVSLSVGFANV